MGRARRIVWSALGLSAPHGPFGTTLRASLRTAIALWAIELLLPWFASGPGSPLGPGGSALLLAATLIAALALGLPFSLLALLLWLGSGGQRPGQAVARWIGGGDGQEQQRRVSSVLALLMLLAVGAAIALPIAREVIGAMAQPRFAAVTVVALHAALLLLALPLWPTVHALAERLRRLLARLPAVGRPFSRVGSTLGVLVALVLLGAGLLLVLAWGTFQFLPWGTLLPLSGALLVAACAALLARRWPVLVRVEGGLFAVALLTSAVALTALDAGSGDARRALHTTLGGRAGYAVALAALDFDGDGHLHVLGGRDCAPFDARINPVAPDVPHNGVDEDCDGADLDPSSFRAKLRRDWPVPESFPDKLPVVLVTVDAFAANRMKELGGQRGNTPRIDALARRGAFFTACFSQGPSTRLSFPSIMTSRWDSQIERRLVGRHPFPIDPSERTLAELLAGAGYETTAIVSDEYFTRRRWKSITQGFKHVVESPARVGKKRHNSAEVTDATLAALDRHSDEHPLFLWTHYYDAHSPHRQPAKGPRFGSSRQDVYDAELQLVDREVGRLIDGLRARFGEQVLIVLTADHGIAFDEPRHRKFNYGYDLHSVVLHVPLIFVGPSIVPAQLDGAVSTMDVAPTLANLLRVKRRTPFEGASLVPEVLEGRSTRPQTLMHQFYITERLRDGADPLELVSLRTERYHLIHDRRVDSYELYEWRKDMLEQDDLAGSAQAKPVLDALRQQLALYTYRYHRRGGATGGSGDEQRPQGRSGKATVPTAPAGKRGG